VTARYTGHLDRTADGQLTWSIRDPWGWEISGTAAKDPAGGYSLSGTLGPPPASLRIPAIDDAPAAEVPT
jgi:hypothetical protein